MPPPTRSAAQSPGRPRGSAGRTRGSGQRPCQVDIGGTGAGSLPRCRQMGRRHGDRQEPGQEVLGWASMPGGRPCLAAGRARQPVPSQWRQGSLSPPAHQLAQDTEAKTSSSSRPCPAVLVMPIGLQRGAQMGRKRTGCLVQGALAALPMMVTAWHPTAIRTCHTFWAGSKVLRLHLCSSLSLVGTFASQGPWAGSPAQLARGKAIKVAGGRLQPSHVDCHRPVVALICDHCAAARQNNNGKPSAGSRDTVLSASADGPGSANPRSSMAW